MFNSKLEKRIESLETHKIQCDLQHESHAADRRILHDKIEKGLKFLENISNILEESKPTITRSKNNFTTIDTLRNWALWLTAILGCIASATAIFHFYG